MNAQILQLKRLFGAPDAALLSGLAAPLLIIMEDALPEALEEPEIIPT